MTTIHIILTDWKDVDLQVLLATTSKPKAEIEYQKAIYDALETDQHLDPNLSIEQNWEHHFDGEYDSNVHWLTADLED